MAAVIAQVIDSAIDVGDQDWVSTSLLWSSGPSPKYFNHLWSQPADGCLLEQG